MRERVGTVFHLTAHLDRRNKKESINVYYTVYHAPIGALYILEKDSAIIK
ncbi:hypothetical protein ACEQPO_10650 [Bacillus sp. SL00103]